jgi:hypothetical protein
VCAENDGVIVSLGDSFPSGDAEPPAHPNCVCDVAPVRDDGADDSGEAPVEEAPTEPGVEQVSVEGEDNVIHDGVVDEAPTPEPEPNFDFDSAKLTPEQMDARDFYNEAREKYGREVASTSRDVVLEEMWKAQGFDALPTLVSQEQMATLIEQGWQPAFRGMATDTPEMVQQYVDQYKTGDTPFGGSGLFGNGTYAGSEATAEHFAQFDTKGNAVEHGQIMQMAINPEARLIDYSDLLQEMSSAREAQVEIGQTIAERYNFPEYGTDAEIQAWRDSLPDDVRATYEFHENVYNDWELKYEDPAHFATSRGYDGYYIVNPQVGFTATDIVNDTYYNILNRGTVAIVR